MATPLWCLLGFATWAVVLTLLLGVVRGLQVLTGKKKSNDFPSGVPHGSDAEWRLNRAQINTLEYLPVFGAIVVVGMLASVISSLFDTLATAVLIGRIGQSLAHLASGSAMAVNVRFTFFLVQVVSFIGMIGITLRTAL